MDVNNSTFLPTAFDLNQISSDSNNSSGSTEKPSSQGQGTGGGPTVSTGGGPSAYASLQGAQGQTGTAAGQNINATTLGQALGATQDSTTNSSLSGVITDGQDGTTGGSLIADIGLSADQQVAPQGGPKGRKSSDTGSGGQSEQGQVYIPSAAASLQQGLSGPSSAGSTMSSKDISTFTLKVDPTTTSDTSTTDSSTTDVNGAPAIPNVYEMVEESTSIGSQLQEDQVSQMVASSNAQNTILSQDYSKQITDINNYIKAQNSSNSKSKAAQAFSWVVNIAMVAVGTLTADPLLIAAGIAGCIMTADPKIVSGLSSDLQKMFPGLPPEVANIMSTLIIVAAASVGTCGVGAIGEGAMEAGSEAAIAATDSGAEAGAETGTDASTDATTSNAEKAAAKKTANNTAETAIKNPINYTQTAKALGTSEGRSAFMEGAMRGAGKTITEAPAKIASSIAKTPEAMANSARSLYQCASRMAEQCRSLGSTGLFEASEAGAEAGAAAGESVSMSEKAITQLKSIASSLTNDPLKMVHITADLTMAALSATGAVENYNATVLKGKAEKDEATVLNSQATTTALTASISLSNTQIQEVLDDMNGDVAGAGQVLAQMSQLSSDTLGQLHGA
ncbi:MAG: hypothetical protein K2W97_02275 [Chthoniobacterales bacterium]|nr:hypothetical protein [Chthoniobacterales bacterium]